MRISFRVDLLRQHVRIGTARCTAVSVTFRKKADVCRGIKATVSADSFRMSPGVLFDMFSDRIRPVLIIDGQEYYLGVFMTIAAPKTLSDTGSQLEIEGYDETMILKQAAYTERTNYPAGTKYLTIINSILTSCGFSQVIEVDSDAVLPADVEIEPGKTYLETINYFLDGINYQHVHADSAGRILLQPNTEKTTADHVYSDTNGMIVPPISHTTDIYNLPNVLVGVASGPDREPLSYVKENTDLNSQISIPKRGYKVVKIYDVNNVADQATLEAYIDQKYLDASQITETVNIETALEGGHEYGDTVHVKTKLISGLFNEVEWSIDSKGKMKHTLERKVFV